MSVQPFSKSGENIWRSLKTRQISATRLARFGTVVQLAQLVELQRGNLAQNGRVI